MLFGMSDNIVIAGDTPYSTSINSSFPSFPVVLVSKIEFSFTQILMVGDCTHRVYPVSAFSLNFSMTASSGSRLPLSCDYTAKLQRYFHTAKFPNKKICHFAKNFIPGIWFYVFMSLKYAVKHILGITLHIYLKKVP